MAISASANWLDDIAWNEQGLVPAIAQDSVTKDILMVAWMNREALAETVATNRGVYFSRSRAKLWRKGEESGNVLRVVEVRIDCDQDALLIVADPAGPACHTGAGSCFYRRVDGHVLIRA